MGFSSLHHYCGFCSEREQPRRCERESWRGWLGLNWDRYGVTQECCTLGEVVLYALLRGGGKMEDNNGVG